MKFQSLKNILINPYFTRIDHCINTFLLTLFKSSLLLQIDLYAVGLESFNYSNFTYNNIIIYFMFSKKLSKLKGTRESLSTA